MNAEETEPDIAPEIGPCPGCEKEINLGVMSCPYCKYDLVLQKPSSRSKKKPVSDEPTIADLKAFKAFVQEKAGGLKKITATVNLLEELVGEVGSIEKVRKIVELLSSIGHKKVAGALCLLSAVTKEVGVGSFGKMKRIIEFLSE